MRIECPNCGAQYEVPDDVIPASGRDVQCSNCGNTWFTAHDDVDQDERTPQVSDDITDPGEFEDIPDPDEDFQQAPIDAPVRKTMDPAVEDILRQEGEREAAARRAEAEPDPLETQPDLGLPDIEDEAQLRARQARERMAKMRGEDPDSEPEPENEDILTDDTADAREAIAAAAALGARRELLPDIEEINSTLRSKGDRDVAGDDPDPEAPVRVRKKRGFRRGFGLSVLIFACAIMIYAFAPQISQSVPQVEPALNGYVAWVDSMRAGLDAWVQEMLRWLDDLAAQSSQ